MSGYEINGTEYWIEEFDEGFAWNNAADEGDAHSAFRPSHLEAPQDAIDWEAGRKERDRQAAEDENHALWQRQQNDSLRGPL